MTTYREITALEDDPEKPVTSALTKAWTDNVLAIAEGDTTAPIVAHGWHPYDKTMNNGAQTGRIWSQAVDGAVATVTTPDFVDGWDYGFLFERVQHSAGTAQAFNINLYRETSAAYAGAVTTGVNLTNAHAMTGFIEGFGFRLTRTAHIVSGRVTANTIADSLTGNVNSLDMGVRHLTAQKILRLQFSFASGNITGTGAAIYMLRRRNPAA